VERLRSRRKGEQGEGPEVEVGEEEVLVRMVEKGEEERRPGGRKIGEHHRREEGVGTEVEEEEVEEVEVDEEEVGTEVQFLGTGVLHQEIGTDLLAEKLWEMIGKASEIEGAGVGVPKGPLHPPGKPGNPQQYTIQLCLLR